MAPGPTRCIQQLTWTPSVVVVEPGASERIVAMALQEDMAVKPPAPPEPGTELAQLQGLLTIYADLSKEVAKPDSEWARELLQQTQSEFERQRREQRKVLQPLIAGSKVLMEQIARRATPKETAEKRARPVTVDICLDSDERSKVRPTALLVAEPSGALSILVGVPVAELAQARSTPRVIDSMEASEEAPPRKSPSQPRSVAPSPSPTAEVRRGADSRFRRVGQAPSERGCRDGSLRGHAAKRHATAHGALRGRPSAAHRCRTARLRAP